jgi:predicted transcriptional regulator
VSEDQSTQSITICAEGDVVRGIDAIAAATCRSRSDVVNDALRHYVDANIWQTDHIREGSRAVGDGEIRSAENVFSDIARSMASAHEDSQPLVNGQPDVRELARKLVTTFHLSMPERKALGGPIPGSLVIEAIRSVLEEKKSFPPSWRKRFKFRWWIDRGQSGWIVLDYLESRDWSYEIYRRGSSNFSFRQRSYCCICQARVPFYGRRSR